MVKRLRVFRCLTPSLLVVALASSAAIASARDGVAFQLSVAPSLSTPVGEMACSDFVDINDKGQTAGTASLCDAPASATVRYSATSGLEDLDPSGDYSSLGFAIDRRGTVWGLDVGGPAPFGESFLHRRRSGFDFLEKGETAAVRDGFFPGFGVRQGLPRSGAVFGAVLFPEGNPALPYVYTKKKGWVDLSGLHPRFAQEPSIGVYINNAGYRVFAISGSSPPGEDPPTGRQDYFVQSPDGTLTEVVSPGRPVTPGSRPNRNGKMAGLYLTSDAKERAYVWTRETGLVDIHPSDFRSSFAAGTNKHGTSFGTLARKNALSDVFVHTDQAGLQIVISSEELSEQAKDRGGRFSSVRAEDMNDSGEIVGCVTVRSGPNFSFYYSPERGLFGLDEILEELGSEYREAGCAARFINNRGQILLESLSNGERSAGAILTVTD